ncbi:MAG: DUF1571 domain-containing protein [Salinivirgaceae bacterium]
MENAKGCDHEKSYLQKLDSIAQNAESIYFCVHIYARMLDDDYRQKAIFKIDRQPLKIYYRQFMRSNIELLYNESLDKDKATVYPDGFPYTSIQLSPYSPRILKRQHHSIFESDPTFTIKQVMKMMDASGHEACRFVVNDTIFDGQKSLSMKYYQADYHIKTVRVRDDASLLDFAAKHNVNFYSIIWNNPSLSITSKLKSNDRIKVPSAYAKSVEIIIDKDNYSLLQVIVKDDNGVFEKYTYTQFTWNANFTSLDFDTENPDYNF